MKHFEIKAGLDLDMSASNKKCRIFVKRLSIGKRLVLVKTSKMSMYD